MVHVTFNEKVECHQYSPSSTQSGEGMGSSIVQGQPRLNYNIGFLKGLRNSPLSSVCPDVVKKGMQDGKPWTRNASNNRSVFPPRQTNTNPNTNRHQRLVPFYQNNSVGSNRDGMFASLEPAGNYRFSGQSRYQQRNDYTDHFANRNQQTDNPLRYDVRQSSGVTNDEDAEPLWFSAGPTSPNDCIELHGFDGPEHQENREGHPRNDQFGCVDGNISGGPTSGASSNNGSPPAKSTPAKVTFMNDSQRNRKPGVGRSHNWHNNNFDNRQSGAGAPMLNEFFKKFSVPQNQSNLRGLTPIVSVEDVESSVLYNRLKFRQMVAQLQTQNMYRNLVYPTHHESIPSASQILSEIDKIYQTSTEQIYKRPEVRALVKNIVEAVIPPINIMNLLKNPTTDSHNRETIQSALKLITQAKNNATMAMKMHTPTESELRAHMDAILQDAIIKKRMETLSNELLKTPYQQGGRNFANQGQSFHQMFQQNSAGRFENHSQSDSRGQFIGNATMPAQENNLSRWFSPSLLNKGLSGELPQVPSDPLFSEELENKIKQTAKDVK